MAATKWSTSGIKIQMNGQPILLKGMCYAPTTKGYSDGVPQVGDWFYDKCGCIWSSDNNGDRADLAQMKNMGINHIRTYFWWRWQWPTDKNGLLLLELNILNGQMSTGKTKQIQVSYRQSILVKHFYPHYANRCYA